MHANVIFIHSNQEKYDHLTLFSIVNETIMKA